MISGGEEKWKGVDILLIEWIAKNSLKLENNFDVSIYRMSRDGK